MAEGRRQRVREKVSKGGINILADHEKLEFMLYPYLPRRDTVPIARELLREFGSLNAVFNATEEELLTIKGMPKLAALTFPQLKPLLYTCEKFCNGSDGRVRTSLDAAEALMPFLGYGKKERVYAMYLGVNGKLLNIMLINEGEAAESDLNVRRIIDHALKAGAEGVILAHNHPSGIAIPSRADEDSTVWLKEALEKVGLKLWDHIIVAGMGNYYSLFNGSEEQTRNKLFSPGVQYK